MAKHQLVWTEKGPVRLLQEENDRVRVQFPGRKGTRWISKTQITNQPEHVILYKKSNFDQKCGCNPVVELRGNKVETYNVYGRITKYLESDMQLNGDLTPHHSRKHLKEHGFVRAKGGVKGVRKVEDVAEYIYDKISSGYHLPITKS